MNQPIKYVILRYKYFKAGKLIFSAQRELSEKEMKDLFDKYYKEGTRIRRFFDGGGFTYKELSKPDTHPMYNNETPFKLKFDKRTYINPVIKSIRWDGKQWGYCIESIGHTHDFQPESELTNK